MISYGWTAPSSLRSFHWTVADVAPVPAWKPSIPRSDETSAAGWRSLSGFVSTPKRKTTSLALLGSWSWKPEDSPSGSPFCAAMVQRKNPSAPAKRIPRSGSAGKNARDACDRSMKKRVDGDSTSS